MPRVTDVGHAATSCRPSEIILSRCTCDRPTPTRTPLPCRSILPEEARYGSTFIFRQGNPLIPDDLRLVKAQEAKSIVIIADQVRVARFDVSHEKHPPDTCPAVGT